MSAWLVDTHALPWFLADDPQLSETARATIESSESVPLVSSASIWEMAIKRSLGKLQDPDDGRAQGFRSTACWQLRRS